VSFENVFAGIKHSLDNTRNMMLSAENIPYGIVQVHVNIKNPSKRKADMFFVEQLLAKKMNLKIHSFKREIQNNPGEFHLFQKI
jgi:hypothetical protein